MGLASALSTALTGLTAAESTIDVVGNNLANSSTVGFKASRVEFATQFLQTQSLGSKPDLLPPQGPGLHGGTNPRQIGLGVQVANIRPDFSQGTIQLSSNPSDLAIQGDGFFIVKGGNGQQLYTRNGSFTLNSQDELVTSTGNKLLGYGVDKNFQINKTQLNALTIDSSTVVAQATQNVLLQGTLTPTGTIADTAEILNSSILSDGQFTAPTANATVGVAAPPDVSGTAGSGSGAGTLNGTFTYKVTFVDANNKETEAGTFTANGANSAQIDLTGVPTASGNYVGRRIYRSTAGTNTNFYLVDNSNNANVTDSTTDAVLTGNTAFDGSGITGNYTYRITWSKPSVSSESRPSAPLTPTINITNGRIALSNLTAPTGDYAGGTINIYRNVAGQPDTFYKVASGIAPVTSFVDNVSDTTLTTANQVLDVNGPPIVASTLLTNVLSRTGNTFSNLFKAGQLSFTPTKGGRELGTKTMTIDGNTTVQNLTDFMSQAMGIQLPGADSHNPVPNDAASGSPPGGLVTPDGRIQLVGNNGTDNAISISLSALKLTPDDNSGVTSPNMGFSSIQSATGQSAAADFIVYDSLGIPLNVRVTAVLESRDSSATTYRWFADSTDNDPATGAGIAVGTGEIKFDGNGNVLTVTNSTVAIDRAHETSVSPLAFNLDFSHISGLASDHSSLSATSQDGSAPGSLSSFIIGEDGTINGVFSNGISRTLGQLALARFANPDGLDAVGNNNYSSGVNSGDPVVDVPGQQGIGTITAGAVELSNTDIGKNLIDLILASTAYRGNTRVITTVDQMLQELLSLQR